MSMNPARRALIVNADDFGLSPGVNRGIMQAHERGIVTSASLMVRYPAAAEAAECVRAHPQLSVGLHVDLGEWTYADEQWQRAYEVVPFTDSSAVAEEVARQLVTFRALVGRDPTHLDSHQHVHHTEPLRSILSHHASVLGVILRGMSPDVRYSGNFYGQSDKGYPFPEGIAVPRLLKLLENLPLGVTEMGCHPGAAADMDGMYRHERLVERDTLCHPAIREAIAAHSIVLCSFLDWARS
jgi:chitin disaccharide deacetylase